MQQITVTQKEKTRAKQTTFNRLYHMMLMRFHVLKMKRNRSSRHLSVITIKLNEPTGITLTLRKASLNDGAIVCVWREVVAQKYLKLPEIRNLHDFLFSKHCVTGEVVARTHMMCYSGPFTPATMHILAGQNPIYNLQMVPQVLITLYWMCIT